MEQGPGALNGEVKADDPAAPGSVGQRARELCFCQETAPSLFTPCSLQQHQDLHPYSEMSVLTRPHFLGSQVVRTVSLVRLDGELWVSDIHVDTLGLPAAVWGEKPRTGSTRSLWSRSAGASVALLGGSISEQKGEGKNSPAQDWGEAWSSKPP